MDRSEQEGVKTKVCSKCKVEKMLECFSRHKRQKHGLRSWCKDCISNYGKSYYGTTRQKQLDYQREYRKSHPNRNRAYREANREKEREYTRQWQKANPDKANAKASKHRASKLKATPSWLTSEHTSLIETFYTEAKQLEQVLGIKHHVDHIVPLQGKNVCGLHVPWNLQVLTEADNTAKKNHYPNEWEDL